MKKSQTRLLALLLVCCMMWSLTACAAADTTEQTEETIAIRIPEAVKYEKCTELGTPLADARVRQALALAIDVDTVVETLHGDGAESAIWEDCAYDPEMAKELLAEAGWPSEYVLDVVYAQDDPQIEDLLNVIVYYWDAVGVQAEVRKITEDAEKQLWTVPEDPDGDSAVNWDLAICAVTDLNLQQFFGRFASDSLRNSHTPAIEELDEALAAGNVELARQILAEQVSFIPLLSQDGFVCVSDHLDPSAMSAGNGTYLYDKDVLNWITDREDNTLYTGFVPAETELSPLENPATLYHELVFDRLLYVDNEGNPADGLIAAHYALSDDAMAAEFTLREELFWHDGEPLTAEDVKFTFELYLRCPDTNPVLKELLEKLEGAEAFVDGDAKTCAGITVEENKVTFRFAEKAEDALEIFSQWPVLPKHKLENVKPAKLMTHKFWKNPVGSGPFKVTELEAGKTCLLERWEDYHQAGEGNINFVRLNADDDSVAVLAALDLLDYGWGWSTDDAAYIGQLDHMQLLRVKRGCAVSFFINQFPHESYHTLEKSSQETQ